MATLVHIQAHLDEDLSTARLAALSGVSPSGFHRLFRTATGETPKRYTTRLRLERAAMRLSLHDTTVLETALEVGFHNHETFTRAFRGHFGVAPRDVARRGLKALPVAGERPHAAVEPKGYDLSPSKLVTVKPMHLAFIRHTGPYEEVPESIWRRLQSWAAGTRIPGPRVLVGLGLDAPGVTPPEKLRYDAAIHLPERIETTGSIGYQLFPGGRFLVSTHVGHYSTVTAAYLRIAARLKQKAGVRFAGLPALEIYHETVINLDSQLNHTDLYLPVVSSSNRAGFV